MHVALLDVVWCVKLLFLDLFEVDLTCTCYWLRQYCSVEVVLVKLHAEDLALLIDAAEMLELAHLLGVEGSCVAYVTHLHALGLLVPHVLDELRVDLGFSRLGLLSALSPFHRIV